MLLDSPSLTWFRCCPAGAPVCPLRRHRRRRSGTRPRTDSCRCCWGWAWCRSPAALRWPSGWIGPLMWSDLWPSPNARTFLQEREDGSFKTKFGESTNKDPPTQHTWSSDAVEVRLGVLREVEVDDHVDGLDVDASGKEIYRRRTEDQMKSFELQIQTHEFWFMMLQS